MSKPTESVGDTSAPTSTARVPAPLRVVRPRPSRADNTSETSSPRRSSAALLVGITGVVAALVYAALALGQFRGGEAHSYDLGIFSQSAASWASGQLPTSGILDGKRLLGDHFSPLTVVFGAAWKLWPDPRALLLLQAVLLGAGAALVARAAVRHLSPACAAAVAVVVTCAHGALGAARFDVHEVCLTVPFLALSATALVERRHLAAGLWSLPLLLVKEDLGATVAAVALLLFLRGRRRLGVVFGLAALAGLALAVVTMVAVNPAHDLSRLSSFADTTGGTATSITGTDRVRFLALVVLGGGVLWLCSPVALLAVPTLAWRVASHEPSYLSSSLHYDTVLVPVLGVALVDGLRRCPPRRVGFAFAWGAAVCSVLVTVVVLPVGTLLQSATDLRPAARLAALRTATAVIPPGVAVAADNSSGVYLLGDSGGHHEVLGWSADRPLADLPDWVVVTTDRPSVGSSAAQTRAWLREVEALPGVSVTVVGDTAVVHLGDRT